MSDKDESGNPEQHELDVEQVGEVAGGSGAVSIGTGGVTISSSSDSLGGDVIRTYEGLIEATSYAIERIAGALK